MNHPNRKRSKDWACFIRSFRDQFRLTQKELAALLPSTVRDIEDIEQGIYSPRPYLKRALNDLASELTASAKTGTLE